MASASADSRPDPVELVLGRVKGSRRNGPGWLALCPAHEDRRPSLGIGRGEGGRALLRCFAGCDFERVVAALGLEATDLFAEAPRRPEHETRREYEIRDEAGRLVAVHVRIQQPDGSKRFVWMRDGSAGLAGLKTADLPLFGVERLSRDPGGAVLVTEGEKAALAGRHLGFLAVATVTGASGCPGPKPLAVLRGRDVLLWPDLDAPGREHMTRVGSALLYVARSVRVIEWPAAPFGGDAADFAHRGGTAEQARELAEAAVQFAIWARTPEAEAKPARPNGHHSQAGPGLAPECSRCGSDSCAGDCGVRAVQAPVFVPASAVMAEPPADWLIEGLVPCGGVAVLAGESGAGKTFVALDAAASAAEGVEWFRCAVKAGSVAYATFEADALALRLQALAGKGAKLDNLYLLRASDPLSPRVERDGTEDASNGERVITAALQGLAANLAQEGRPPIVAVFVDTVRASLSGSEDSSESVSAYLRAVRRILTAVPGAAAVLVHHAGWQDGETKRKRERGSSAFRGNVDATLYLEATEDDGDGRTYLALRTLKVRDAERRPPLRMVRERVDVPGFDRHGQPLSSCIVIPDTRTREDVEAARAAELAAEDRRMDLDVLTVMHEHPEVTNQEKVRSLVGSGAPAVRGSIARLLRAKWATQGRRGQPYTITEEGLGVLQANRTEADRNGPRTSSVRPERTGLPDSPLGSGPVSATGRTA